MSVENCLKIFDEKQARMEHYILQRKLEEENQLRDEQRAKLGF